MASIAAERTEIEGQLAETATKLDAGSTFFLTALELLRDPQAFYRRGGASVKHALTKVIFAKLYLDMRDVTLVSGHDLGEGLGDLIEAEELTRTLYRRSDTLEGWEGTWGEQGRNNSNPFDAEEAALNDLTGADLLAWTLVGHGSSRAALVDLVVTYSNRSDLREQLQQAVMILLDEASRSGESGSCADREVCSTTRWWSLHDRFSPEDLQIMIDLYKSGTTAKQVAARFSVSVRSVTRLLRQYGVRRERCKPQSVTGQ